MPRTCFVICPIGDEGSDVRKRSDVVLSQLIEPAVDPFGFKVTRADQDRTPGIITVKVIRAVLEADLVVADLVDLNPNVLYELAVRHASRRPVVHMCPKGQALPFDIAQFDTVFYTTELADRATTLQQLTAAVHGIDEGRPTANPVSLIVDLQTLATSPFAGAAILSDQLQDLRRAIAELRSQSVQTPGSTPPAPGEHAMRVLSSATLASSRLRTAGFTSLTLGFDTDDSVELRGVRQGVVIGKRMVIKDWWIQSDERIRSIGDELVDGLILQPPPHQPDWQ
jgi:hypothetical protein